MNAEKIGGFLGTTLWVALMGLYITGIVALISDDHRYTTKNLLAGVVLFPYTWYVGGKTIYHYTTTSGDHRRIENKCLDYADGQGLTRKSRLFICECVADGSPVQQCNADYEKEFQAANS